MILSHSQNYKDSHIWVLRTASIAICIIVNIMYSYVMSVLFEIAPKYYISDSFVDYEGYSISSMGFLPTIVM